MSDLETETKSILVSRLAELLSQLPADAKVRVNAVGNLLVTNSASDEPIAFVDFAGGGSVESMKP